MKRDDLWYEMRLFMIRSEMILVWDEMVYDVEWDFYEMK